MGIVKHGLGEGGMDEVGVDGVSRVDEDDGLSFAQLCPDGDKGFVAKVGFTLAIASEEGDAVGAEVVECVGDFGEGGLGVEEGGERGEEAIGSRILLFERCAVLVAAAG